MKLPILYQSHIAIIMHRSQIHLRHVDGLKWLDGPSPNDRVGEKTGNHMSKKSDPFNSEICPMSTDMETSVSLPADLDFLSASILANICTLTSLGNKDE